jgi:hypothetical protein
MAGILDPERRLRMPDFNPFDMDFDGDVDGIDFLGFHYLVRQDPERAAGHTQGRADTTADIASLIGVAVLSVTVLWPAWSAS